MSSEQQPSKASIRPGQRAAGLQQRPGRYHAHPGSRICKGFAGVQCTLARPSHHHAPAPASLYQSVCSVFRRRPRVSPVHGLYRNERRHYEPAPASFLVTHSLHLLRCRPSPWPTPAPPYLPSCTAYGGPSATSSRLLAPSSPRSGPSPNSSSCLWSTWSKACSPSSYSPSGFMY